MTVLSQYERLECPGIWRASEDAQRRDVFVSLGDASLIIKDANDVALSHWSLPAVKRTNAGTRPALYRPGPDADEDLEIDDPDMIDAISTVQRAVAKATPKPGLLRRGGLLLALACIVAVSVFWLPNALVQHTAQALPNSVRVEIGQRLLRKLEPIAGRPCEARDSKRALTVFTRHLFGPNTWEIVVVPGGPVRAAHLPGRVLLLRSDAVEDQSTPEVAAGLMLAEAFRATAQDPMIDVMNDAGFASTFGLLTRGEISDEALQTHAERLLTLAPSPVSVETLLPAFQTAGLSTKPYAEIAADETSSVFVAADPFPNGSERQILSDSGWLRLQAICER